MYELDQLIIQHFTIYQLIIFFLYPSKAAISTDEADEDENDADEGQRGKEEADARAGNIGGGGSADLRANGRTRLHHQRDQDVDIPFQGMGQRAIAGGDDDLEEIGAYSDMGRHADEVDEHRHADEAAAYA